MFNDVNYVPTYCAANAGNVRYPSGAQGAEGGWVYIFTKDAEYVWGLSRYHAVEIRIDGHWTAYSGYLSDADEP